MGKRREKGISKLRDLRRSKEDKERGRVGQEGKVTRKAIREGLGELRTREITATK
jgi:hypothetical protein